MINLKLEDLSTEQKLGMLLCARTFDRVAGEEDTEYILQLIRDHSLGCVQIPATRPDVMRRVREAADYPILIICDTETGFPTSELPKVPLMALSACNRPEYYRSFARGVVTEAKQAGYNGTWSPVVDVLLVDGPCQVYRQISDDPMRVALGAEEIAQVYANNHYLSGCKHYPGGRDCPYDSHMTGSWSNKTEQELLDHDLIPYLHLMRKGLLPSIMTSHAVYNKIEPGLPATLSPKVLDILRRQGFDGVCFTDSFAMMSILQEFGEENVIGMAVAAGNDIVLPNFYTTTKTSFEYLKKNYADGMFTEERLNEAVWRVLAAQAFVGQEPEQPDLFTPQDRINFESIARDCITAVTDPDLSAALPQGKSRLFVVSTPNSFSADVGSQEIDVGQWYFPDRVADAIRAEFPDAHIEFLPEYAENTDNERVLRASTKYDETVFVSFCITKAYLGTDCLSRRTESVINALAYSGKLAALVHFGNPFALQPLLHIPRKIFGYTMPQAQPCAIQALSGRLDPSGKLPFQIDFA